MAFPWSHADLRHLLLRKGCLSKKQLKVDEGIRYCTLVLREGDLVVTGMTVLLLADDLVLFWCCLSLHEALFSLTGGLARYEHLHLHLLCGSRGNQWSSTIVAYYWLNGARWTKLPNGKNQNVLAVAFLMKMLLMLQCWLEEPLHGWKSCPCLSLSFIVLVAALDWEYSLLSKDQGCPIRIMVTKSGECCMKRPATVQQVVCVSDQLLSSKWSKFCQNLPSLLLRVDEQITIALQSPENPHK